MKHPSLLALCIAAAGLALVPAVQAGELRQVFPPSDGDSAAATQEPAAPIEWAGPTDSDRQLEDLREQVARDLAYE